MYVFPDTLKMFQQAAEDLGATDNARRGGCQENIQISPSENQSTGRIIHKTRSQTPNVQITQTIHRGRRVIFAPRYVMLKVRPLS